MTVGVTFGLLGPVKAWSGGQELEIGTPHQRGVLARLLLSEGQQIPAEAIVDALWGADAPAGALRTTRSYISRLRTILEGAGSAASGSHVEIRSVGRGYQLVSAPGTVDVAVFRQALAMARDARGRGEAGEASRLLGTALDLWRGPALDALGGPYFAAQRTWLEELLATAKEDRWTLDIGRGQCAEAIEDLTQATAAQPYRERFWELLISALHREGRRSDALSAYRRIERLLDDDLGLEPGAGLRRVRASLAVIHSTRRLDPQRRLARA
ncbi:MAG: family transcriptional regulator, regulator of embCAB operon [Kribbellaceae bacterium]|nr:family transcriptional regulator, regulator of embCAB operon [Kribbellaceae bacterium]